MPPGGGLCTAVRLEHSRLEDGGNKTRRKPALRGQGVQDATRPLLDDQPRAHQKASRYPPTISPQSAKNPQTSAACHLGLDTDTVELIVKTLLSHAITLERIRFSRQFCTDAIIVECRVLVAPPCSTPRRSRP
eukprot:1180145-Prorocentrum_minimum.AAC.6